MNTGIPSQKEIQEYLGPTLAQAFFDLSNPDIKKFIGITPPLKGPDEHLWQSPSDLLIGKNCLKLPISRKITQAVTHDGVIELGEKALKQYEASLEKNIRQSLCADMKNIQLLLKAEQKCITNQRVKEIKDEYAQQIRSLTQEYDKILEQALDDVMRKYNKILQKALVQTRMNTTHEMMKKMRKEVDFIVTDMNEDYERRCLIQRENLIADFNGVIRQERAKIKEKLSEYQIEKNKNVEMLKAELENKYRENTAKIIRRERTLCDNEKKQIYQDLTEIINSLEKSLVKANDDINQYRNKPPIVIPPNDKYWRTRIQYILQEFQKFTDCVMKFTSEEANFLLPRLSLLRFPNEEL